PLLALGAVQQLLRLLVAQAAAWLVGLRLTRRAPLVLAATSGTPSSSPGATSATALLLLLSERELVVPLRVAVTGAHEQRPLVCLERRVERGRCRVTLCSQATLEVRQTEVEHRAKLHFRIGGLCGAFEHLDRRRECARRQQRRTEVVENLGSLVAALEGTTVQRRSAHVSFCRVLTSSVADIIGTDGPDPRERH